MSSMGYLKQCVFRITGNDRERLETLVFRRYPDREWGTFFSFGYRITPWGMHICFVAPIEPGPGDLKEDSGIVEFSAGYILRAQFAVADNPLGVGVIHSHPQDCGTGASALDEDMDTYFSGEFAAYGGGRPYASLRLARNSNGSFAFSGEAWLNGKQTPIVDFLTVGEALERETCAFHADQEEGDMNHRDWNVRMRELIGGKVGRLSAARVAVIGCSGLGSPAVHVLARAGVRRFVLVDPERFSPSNHERLHGSNWRDCKALPLKVKILRRLILEIQPSAEVTMIRGNVLDEVVLDELLRCDLVLGCTDSQHSRAALGDFANHYLLPCLDAAVLMRARNGKLTEQVGEIVRYSAEEPCPWCLGRINQKALACELMPEAEREQRAHAAEEAARRGVDGAQYWGDKPPQELTVGYMTTTVGAMQAGYAEGWITGAGRMPHQRMQFDLGMPFLGVVSVEKSRRAECSCNRTKSWSDQVRADRSVTMPGHWGRAEMVPAACAEASKASLDPKDSKVGRP